MANTKGRTYAEDLVGALDRSAVGLQRDVAQSSYNTNWKNIQNQYENLQAQLKQKQQEANEKYANGLVDVASNSFDRMRNSMNNMSNRNIINSGMQDLVRQSDIKQKGQEVDALLDEANNVAKQTAEGLSQGGTSANAKANELAGNLAKTLSEITSNDISSQNQYNNTLANLAEAMESRLDNNERVQQNIKDMLSSARRSASSSSKDIDDKMEELYKRQGMMEIIASDDLNSEQKTAYLAGLYEINPEVAQKAVDAYDTSKIDINKYKEEKQSEINKGNKSLKKLQTSKKVAEDDYNNRTNDKTRKLADRAAQNYDGNNKIAKAFIKAAGGKTKQELQAVVDDYQRQIENKQNEIKALEDELNNFGYKDIYDILYK